MLRLFHDRRHAGEILADALTPYVMQYPHLFIIPNGGVPVALPIVQKLYRESGRVQYDLLPVKKIHIPHRPVGFGAVTLTGEILLNAPLVTRMKLSPFDIQELASLTLDEINHRKQEYGIKDKNFNLKGRITIIIDEGLPSGITMIAAITSLQKFKPSRLIIAVPTASKIAIDRISSHIGEIICNIV